MIHSATLVGIEARVLSISSSRNSGVVPLSDTGLSEAATREARVRVQAALMNAQVEAAASLAIEGAPPNLIDGAGLDLALALAAAEPPGAAHKFGAYAELSLAGDLRPVRGVISALEALRGRCDAVVVGPENATEASLVTGLRVYVARTLKEALSLLHGATLPSPDVLNIAVAPPRPQALSLDDVLGNDPAKRALEVAAAGSHNVLLVGPAGAGKTMLARRLPALLPPLTRDEQLDVTRIHSAAGLNIGGGICRERPFRAPHHSTTPPGLVGGGTARPRPGEVTLAHNGVLFLDELPEFSQVSLEVLLEPAKSGEVLLMRANGSIRFPARSIIVASMCACPCGRGRARPCRCSPTDVAHYQGRLERVLELFHIRVEVEPVSLEDAPPAPRRHVDTVNSVIAARAARTRLHRDPTPSTRLLQVARTLADLDLSVTVEARHLDEAKKLSASVPR